MSMSDFRRRPTRYAPTIMMAAFSLYAGPAVAGNGANFILYNHHTEEKGETEVKLFYDVSSAANDDPSYNAQLAEIEYGVTDQWTTSLYLSAQKTSGENYDIEGLRFENRVRLFDYGAFLNPVLYVEYERLRSTHKYIRAVVGRTDPVPGEVDVEEKERIENEFETRLILGHDFSDRFNVALNLVSEVETREQNWEFGYVLGFNYALFKTEEREGHGGSTHADWSLKEVELGVELYGGLGDSDRGLTLASDETAQYAGASVKTEFANGFSFTVGGAAGLTRDAEDGLLRLSVGKEFE